MDLCAKNAKIDSRPRDASLSNKPVEYLPTQQFGVSLKLWVNPQQKLLVGCFQCFLLLLFPTIAIVCLCPLCCWWNEQWFPRQVLPRRELRKWVQYASRRFRCFCLSQVRNMQQESSCADYMFCHQELWSLDRKWLTSASVELSSPPILCCNCVFAGRAPLFLFLHCGCEFTLGIPCSVALFFRNRHSMHCNDRRFPGRHAVRLLS